MQRKLSGLSRTVQDLPRDLQSQYPQVIDFFDIEKLELLPGTDERRRGIVTLVEKLIPSSEKFIEKEPKAWYLVYPEDKTNEIFNKESSRHNVGLIHFLLDTNITHWWANIENDEFEKFLQAAKENHLPSCLTSQEEMTRTRAEALEVFDAMLDATIINRDLSMPPFRIKEENLSKPKQGKEQAREPARKKFLELYSENKNFDISVKEITTIYLSEI